MPKSPESSQQFEIKEGEPSVPDFIQSKFPEAKIEPWEDFDKESSKPAHSTFGAGARSTERYREDFVVRKSDKGLVLERLKGTASDPQYERTSIKGDSIQQMLEGGSKDVVAVFRRSYGGGEAGSYDRIFIKMVE